MTRDKKMVEFYRSRNDSSLTYTLQMSKVNHSSVVVEQIYPVSSVDSLDIGCEESTSMMSGWRVYFTTSMDGHEIDLMFDSQEKCDTFARILKTPQVQKPKPQLTDAFKTKHASTRAAQRQISNVDFDKLIDDAVQSRQVLIKNHNQNALVVEEPEVAQPEESNISVPVTDTPTQVSKQIRFKAIFAYQARTASEMDIQVGDVITTEVGDSDDVFVQGTINNDRSGTFPLFLCERIEE